MRRGRSVLPFWVAGWLACLLFLLLGLLIPDLPHRVEYTRLRNRQGIPLWVVVYSPEPNPQAGAPAAVLIQPFTTPPEAGRLLALELVENGFVVLTFDWRGREHGENRQLFRAGARETLRSDVTAAITYLRSRAGVDPARVMLAGHSVGGTLAIEVAVADPAVAAVASIGMEADVSPEAPRNLLWATGLYDEFRVLNRMRDVFQASAGAVALENTTVGNLAHGTARRLGVSPTADHFTELLDRHIHREVRDWFLQAAGLSPNPEAPRQELRRLLFLLAWLSALVAALATARRFVPGGRLALGAMAAGALAGVVALTRVGGEYFLLATEIILWLFLFVLFAGFLVSREEGALRGPGRVTARILLVGWASLFLTFVVNNAANYFHEPRYLLWLPEFAVRHVLDMILSYLVIYPRPLLFSVYEPTAISPRLWLYGLMGLEAVFPGVLLGTVVRVAKWRPRPAPQAETPRPARPVASLVLLFLLVGALGVVGWLRFQQGFLTGESAWAALRFILRFGVLPLFLFALLWRATRRRRAPPHAEGARGKGGLGTED